MLEVAMPVSKLIQEIQRDLAAVDVFRALGCGPEWRTELSGR
jgi:hypothetical protein